MMNLATDQISSREDVQAQLQKWLQAYGNEQVAVADLLCDRHVEQLSGGDNVALLYEDGAGNEAQFTFAELRDLSTKFAGVLADLGVVKGDRVATLLPRSPELVIATLGLWRLGAVHVPLFTAFGLQAIKYRVEHCGARVLVTDGSNRAKVGETALSHVVTVEAPHANENWADDIPFWAALASAEPFVTPMPSKGGDGFIQLYTSGTTGAPKGVEVPVKALAAIEAYMRLGLDLRPEDRYWNMADPGWAYGLYYALIGPLLLGHTTLFFNAPFDVQSTFRILRKYGVTNLATAPTVFRLMRAAGETGQDLQLRVASCAGEPLNPEILAWAIQNLGIPIHDQYGQTEMGMVVTNHHHQLLQRQLRPGSMGHPMPGFRAVILNDSGAELGPGQEGQLAVDTAQSPLYWFQGYWQEPARTAERFSPDRRYYLTGDAASMDTEGYIYFSGRNDDIISSAGYRIGPFELESALMGHPAVAESAVVGKPDPIRGEVVKAYVVVKAGYVPSEELAEALRQHVRTNVSAHAYPREIAFIDQLPKTPSGKIQRFLLRK